MDEGTRNAVLRDCSRRSCRVAFGCLELCRYTWFYYSAVPVLQIESRHFEAPHKVKRRCTSKSPLAIHTSIGCVPPTYGLRQLHYTTMRSFNSGGVCTYGLNSQAGYLFERNQNVLRQRSFGRARGFMGAPLKRSRDHDSDSSDEEALRYPQDTHGARCWTASSACACRAPCSRPRATWTRT